ncbi:MAG: T9SS type A sorting domain-containing protein, partial [Candidatus Delongbacteria bacterium]|nr:T9SS type A sorting domain-containing protein [Candidatus Delongbacteria bacterium]
MKKITLMLFLISALFVTTTAAEKYAVIIAGDLASGGFGGTAAFWNDTYIAWEMLIKQGFEDDNIYVLYGDDGNDFPTTDTRYDPEIQSQFLEDVDVDDITDFSATKTNIRNVASILTSSMQDDDFLFVQFNGHGAWSTKADSTGCFQIAGGYGNEVTEGGNVVSKIYNNDISSSTFSDIEAGLPGVMYGSSALGDYDGDSDLDILITGYDGDQIISKVFKNNVGVFVDSEIELPGVMYSSTAWGDFNDDGDLDILISGYTGNERITNIYLNDGDGTFTELVNTGITGVSDGSIDLGDYNDDGDLDILLTGKTDALAKISKVYKNNGDNSFTDISGNLTGVSHSSVLWGDYDNDNDLDIIITGNDGTTQATEIYKNEGSDTFTEVQYSLPNISHGSVAWGDYDNDGDLDLILSGYQFTINGQNGDHIHNELTELYEYDSTSDEYNKNTSFDSTYDTFYGSFPHVSWADFDNDGYLDILLNGYRKYNEDLLYSSIFFNDTDDTFTSVDVGLDGTAFSSLAIADIDNDNELDILITGYSVDEIPSDYYGEKNYPAQLIIRPEDDEYPESYSGGKVHPQGYFDLLSDKDFADLFNPIPANKKVFWMGSCFSGGYLSELTEEQSNVYFVSGSRWFEQATFAYSYGYKFIESGSNYTKQYTTLPFSKGNHSEVLWHMMSTSMGERINDGAEYYYDDLSGYSAYYYYNSSDNTIYTDGFYAPNDGFEGSNVTLDPLNDDYKSLTDNIITIEESKLWTFDHYVFNAGYPTEIAIVEPDYSDTEEIGYHTSLRYPTLIFNNSDLSYDSNSSVYDEDYANSIKGIMGISQDLDISESLTLPSNSHTTLLSGESSSVTINITVEDGQVFTVSDGAYLELLENSKIIVEDGGTLTVENGSNIYINSGAAIVIEEGGIAIINEVDDLAISTSSGTIDLSWDAYIDATGYHIYRSTNPEVNFYEIGTSSIMSFTDPQTSFVDSVYFYKVIGEIVPTQTYTAQGICDVNPNEGDYVGFSKTTCINYSGGSDDDFHNIALLFDEDYSYSDDIDPNGSDFRCITKYDNVNKAWVTSTYEPSTSTWSPTFDVYHGQALRIHDLQDDFDFITDGVYTEIPSYNLITGVNFIAHPMRRYDLTTSVELGEDIGYCNALWEWDSVNQGWAGSSYGYFGWTNPFSIDIGTPLYINTTTNGSWPGSSSKNIIQPLEERIQITTPKALYFHVVNAEEVDYDFSDADSKTEFIQPKDDYVEFKAWITGREDDILTEKTFGCGFENLGEKYSTVFLNFGNFEHNWSEGEEINIEVTDNSNKHTGTVLKGYAKKLIDNTDNVFNGYSDLIKDSGDPIVVKTPISVNELLPTEITLSQNYPNPFNPVTEINYALPEAAYVSMKIYNAKGETISELVNTNMNSGYHTVQFNASKYTSGVFYYQLNVNGETKMTKKMLLVK